MSKQHILNEEGIKALMEANGYEVPTSVAVAYEVMPVPITNKRHALLMHIIKTLEGQGLKFGNDIHVLSYEQVRELAEWADSVQYKGSTTSSVGRGRLFYLYLGRVRQTYTE